MTAKVPGDGCDEGRNLKEMSTFFDNFPLFIKSSIQSLLKALFAIFDMSLLVCPAIEYF